MGAIRTFCSKRLYHGMVGHVGGFVAHARRELAVREHWQWQTPDVVRERQLAKLRRLVAHAAAQVPYYRQLRSRGLFPDRIESFDDLAIAPPLTKEPINADPRVFIADGRPADTLLPRWTGGSSGDAMKFFVASESMAHFVAAEDWGNSLAGCRPGDAMAQLWGSHLDAHHAATLRQRLARYAANIEVLVTDVMADDRMAEIDASLRRFRPSVVVGYVNSLMEMAGWFRRVGRQPDWPLRSIITAAEPLSEPQRAAMQNAWGAPVFNRYGARECSLVAMECSRHSGLHVDCEDIYVELVPCHDEGLQGYRILVTKLNELAMPMIRYELGDYTGAPLTYCPCGRGYPVLQGVQGRHLSILRRRDGGAVPGEVMVAILGALPVRSYRVVQSEDYSLSVEVVPDAGYDARAEADIGRHLSRVMGDLPIDLRVCQSIPKTPSGKLLPVVSRVRLAREAAR